MTRGSGGRAGGVTRSIVIGRTRAGSAISRIAPTSLAGAGSIPSSIGVSRVGDRRSMPVIHKDLALAAMLLALVVAGCGGGAGNTLKGTFTLNDEGVEQHVGSCNGTGGYSDFKPGMPVTVKNEAGEIIGNSSTTYLETVGDRCALAFEVRAIPAAKFYTITVGRRGDLTYSEADLRSMNWTLALSLG